MILSGAPFPGYTEKLEWCREESGGNWSYNRRLQGGSLALPGLVRVFRSGSENYLCPGEAEELIGEYR